MRDKVSLAATGSVVLVLAMMAGTRVWSCHQTDRLASDAARLLKSATQALDDMVAIRNSWIRHWVPPLATEPDSQLCEGNRLITIAKTTLQATGIICQGLGRNGVAEVIVHGTVIATEQGSRVPTTISLFLNGYLCTARDCRSTVYLEGGKSSFELRHRANADEAGRLTVLLDFTGCVFAKPSCQTDVRSVSISAVK